MKFLKVWKVVKFFLFLFAFVGVGILFYKINDFNYLKIKELKLNKVEHPEFLPKSDFAKISSFGFKKVRADIYWIDTIQYIGGNVISLAYKKYLYTMLNLITDLDPYFSHPYEIGMLLLPDYNPRYEKITEKEQLKYIKQAEKLGLKGIRNFCDLDKVNAIKKEDDLKKIWTLDKYKDPCKNFMIPYHLAFVYYFYLHDYKESSNYYKVASANKDSLEGIKVLTAIMRGKSGDRKKAFLMFINMGKIMDNTKEKVCSKFGDFLQEKIAPYIFTSSNIDSNLIKKLGEIRTEFLGTDTDEDKKIKTDCIDYMNKATRELNLYYIERANDKYKKDYGKNAKNAKVLFDEGYINYLPIDYQQRKDYGIIYFYNKDSGNFDYRMGKY